MTRLHASLFTLCATLTLSACAPGDDATSNAAESLRAAPVIPNVTFGERSLYGEWGARWWQWMYRTPVTRSPLLDTSGARCAEGQQGPVWYLAGYLVGDGTTSVTRACTVPFGRALFFPIVNTEWDPWGAEPPPTDDDLRASVRASIDGTTDRYATLDGVAIPHLDRGRGAAGPFSYAIPSGGDDFLTYWGYPGAPSTVERAFSDGYWLMLPPLAPGRHELRFGGRFADGSEVNVTYHLTVAPRGR